MSSWQVNLDSTVVGVLTQTDIDQPWIQCGFSASPEFVAYAALFERELELLNADLMEEWEASYDKIDEPGLSLTSTSGSEDITNVLLHFGRDSAWFRY